VFRVILSLFSGFSDLILKCTQVIFAIHYLLSFHTNLIMSLLREVLTLNLILFVAHSHVTSILMIKNYESGWISEVRAISLCEAIICYFYEETNE
jgi:hypothetical protein